MENTNILTIQERDELLDKIADLMIKRKAFDAAQEKLVEQMRELLEERSVLFSYIRSKLKDRTDEKSLTVIRAIDRAEIFIEQVFSPDGKLRHWDIFLPILLALDPTNTSERTKDLLDSITTIVFSENPSKQIELINPKYIFHKGV